MEMYKRNGGNEMIDHTTVLASGVLTKGNSYHVTDNTDTSGLQWKNGIGTLPGSDLKFRKDERGDIEVIVDAASSMSATAENVHHGLYQSTDQTGELRRCGRNSGLSLGGQGTQEWLRQGVQQLMNQGGYFHDSFIATSSFDTNGRGSDHKTIHDAIRQQLTQNETASVDRQRPNLERRESFLARNEAVSHTMYDFSWDRYLSENNAIAAPQGAFQDITGRNSFPPPMKFAVGDLLESVDPLHQSLICAVSVVEVKGCRMRLHFEGYSTLHDFWVNSDDKLIFPCGFCKNSGRKLHPPKEHGLLVFEWSMYAAASGKAVTTEEKFRDDFSKCYEMNAKFKIGEKLEAVDRQNRELICVATVSDIIDDRILIHFDGWNHNFDYWCDHSSNYIHPVGWCRKNEKLLAVPNECGADDSFSWIKYLKDTDSKAAKEESFTPRKSHGFDIGMKLEVVDKRNPILVRVATVIEKNAYEIKIHFDGWEDIYDYWIDVDSADLHPAGWCTHTGHPLQPNITAEESQAWQAGCPVPGCRGLGHIKGSKFVGHHSEYGCPYSSKNLDSYPIQDRIMPRRGPKPSSLMSRRMVNMCNNKDKTSGNENEGRRSSSHRKVSRNTFIGSKDGNFDNTQAKKRRALESDMGEKCLYYSFYRSSLWSSVPNKHLATYWEQCTRALPGVTGAHATEICKWSSKEVAKFVGKLTGEEKYGEMFLNEEIDGEAFLLLTQNDISKVLKIKLGPTLKIHGAILYARAND